MLQGPRWSKDFVILPSAARGSSGESNPLNVADFLSGVLFLEVTAGSGTGRTLAFSIEISPDNLSWFDSGMAFTSLDSSTSLTFREALALSSFAKYIKVKYTIGGSSPSWTFSIQGHFKA